MSDLAVKIENLSKQYRLGQVGTGTLSHDLNRWMAKIRGKQDPTAKIGQENILSKAGGDYVWALKDINLEIKKGEVLGIIGKNGAGKSTLLKILSRVTGPTTGSVKVNGRIACLLEVGTGFHPELTGKENIYLNGAILGMTKREITSKLEEIVEFAGVAKYLDTPVKRYSSGMYVRLAFAVAAHLESEILVVDEVLAVGDAEFQKKAIGKMQDVSRGDGRTVLFVSHNMSIIQSLCAKTLLLSKGQIQEYNRTEIVIPMYIDNKQGRIYKKSSITNNMQPQIMSCEILELTEMQIVLHIEINSPVEIKKASIDFRFFDNSAKPIAFASLGTFNENKTINIPQDKSGISAKIDIGQFAIGTYFLSIDLAQPNAGYYDRIENCNSFDVTKKPKKEEWRVLQQNWSFGSFQLNAEKV